MSNISAAADSLSATAGLSSTDFSGIYATFTTQNAATDSVQWLIATALMVVAGITVLYVTRPKDFSNKEAFQAYYESYRSRAI